jgi:hypothetical protein
VSRSGGVHKAVRRDREGEGSLRTQRKWAQILSIFLAASGCTNAVPTSDDGNLIPVDAVTVEVHLPFASFARDLRSFSGFGSPADVPVTVLAHQWEGELESRALVRIDSLPDWIAVRLPGSSSPAVHADSMYQPVSGKVILRLDTLGLGGESFELEAGAVLTPWDPETANWEVASDTLGAVSPSSWPEPGGGPVRSLVSETWGPADGDSLVLDIDSLTITEMTEADRSDRGLRVRGLTKGTRIRVMDVDLRVLARSSINPDTLVEVTAELDRGTVIYSPSPETSSDVLQIGGAPADRTTFRMELPLSVDVGVEVCAKVRCPLELRADRILFAGLVLHTHTTLSPGFAPASSIAVEVRPVLSPERLPRSPLSPPVNPGADGLAPDVFSSETETLYEIPMTGYLRTLLEPDLAGGVAPSSTLALLVRPEPPGLEVISFYGVGTQLGPYLRLVLTVSDGVPLP